MNATNFHSAQMTSAWSSSPVIILITLSAAVSSISSNYRLPVFISRCYIHPLEQLASWYSVIRLPDWFLPQTKDVLVTPIISRHFAVTIHISTSLPWICNDSCYSSQVKNFDLIRLITLSCSGCEGRWYYNASTCVTCVFRTPLGRSRAWLRLALMQKKLADYFRILVDNRDNIL